MLAGVHWNLVIAFLTDEQVLRLSISDRLLSRYLLWVRQLVLDSLIDRHPHYDV